MKRIHNIIRVDRVRVSSITGYIRVGESSARVGSDIPWNVIPIKVPAKLSISDKIEDGVRLHTAQLVFRTCEDAGDLERWAYRCYTADGRTLLIGTSERPYPVGIVTQNHPDNMTDSQLDEVTVSYTSASRIPYIQ